MKAINIYIQEYKRIWPLNLKIFLTKIKKVKCKSIGVSCDKTLVDLLLDINIEIKHFENIFASFTIEQIGKETE